jgi:putative transposase
VAALCAVERLMRRMDLHGAVRGKETRTTMADKASPCPAGKVNRQLRAPQPNRLWLPGFRYVATWQGFAHVAFVIDALARRIVGWRTSRRAHAVEGSAFDRARRA